VSFDHADAVGKALSGAEVAKFNAVAGKMFP
jgi:hypothetical protein